MNDILSVINNVANAKNVPKEAIFEAMEGALSTVSAKQFGEDVIIRVSINRTSGEYQTKRVWQVVEDDTEEFNENQQMSIVKAHQLDEDINVGDEIEEIIPSVDFGRIDAHLAKQVITRIVRDAERTKLAEYYSKRIGDIVSGRAKRVTKDCVIIDLTDNIEASLPRSEMLPKESIRNGDRVRGYLKEVVPEGRGPLVTLSRTCNEFLVELFKHEVPEISDGVITIKACSRDPGSRAKIAVKAKDTRIDPIGACIGVKGSRVQAVSNELHGERVDIILWDDQPAHFVINAMAPAEVKSVTINEKNRTIDLALDPDQLSQAIGRNGQNVRLASELTNWKLNIMSEDAAVEKSEKDTALERNLFTHKLDVDDDIANVLIREGYSSLSEITQLSALELGQIEEFDNEIAEELINRSKQALLTDMMEFPDSDLNQLKSASEALLHNLRSHKINSISSLADLSTDELNDIGIPKDQAGKIIMEARDSAFKNTETSEDHE
ncbi:MAG TPA: transcription termination factor NusA [Gammaproteobacteria bacterium]|nr:transcription termination factor NusA [Gammaproteobacteria bacterium]